MAELEDFQPIEWTESMATGIDVIDKQHQYLVGTLQDANSRLLADDDNQVLSRVVKDLLRYAITHFETEESLMQRYDYAIAYPEEARIHISQHRVFSHRVVAFSNQIRERQAVSRIEILKFLNYWLHNHVSGIDQQLGIFLKQKMGEPDGKIRQ
jgi:hemerythrin